jgi:hypothetical protein
MPGTTINHTGRSFKKPAVTQPPECEKNDILMSGSKKKQNLNFYQSIEHLLVA